MRDQNASIAGLVLNKLVDQAIRLAEKGSRPLYFLVV
jgi:hypothetical protein